MKYKSAVLTLAVLLAACNAPAPKSQPASLADASTADLACQLASNCVNSRDTGGLAPLRYTGTPEQALAVLKATVATFPEAKIERTEPLALALIFTTPAGFRDQVNFKINAQERVIEFRSRSLFGLFDFGKNRARMQEFATRFEQQSRG